MSQPLLPIGTNTPIFIINLSSSRKVKVRRGAASCISFSAAYWLVRKADASF
ncbi:hypothetical protein SFyv_1434 [Shigella flexneri Shi06HN006]|nr:hypothetical protein SFyv_1434 [Shigella flexneri Shi06HN006]